jgi:predicted ribosome quality control (RQC) complex YloA/Tae2 family protein
MNNYYTLHHQSTFLGQSLRGATLVSVISRKKRLLECNFNQNGIPLQLVFHTANPSALFQQDGMNDSRTNAATFFEVIWGLNLQHVKLDESDRVIRLTFQDGYEVILIAYAPNSNAYLYHRGVLIDQFRSTRLPEPKDQYQRGDVGSVERGASLREKILTRDPRFPRHLIDKLIMVHGLDVLDSAELCMMIDSLIDTMLHKPVFRRLSDNSICLLDEKHLPDPDATEYEDVNTLIRSCWVQREIRDRFISRKQQMESELEAAERRLISIQLALDDDSKSLQRADQYEVIGHILMANSYLSMPTTDSVELEDIYNPPQKVTVKVKKGVSFSENAQVYYQKAKNTRKTLDANKERLAETTLKLNQLNVLRARFLEVDGPRTFDRWLKLNERTLSVVIPSRQMGVGSGKPWRTLRIGNYDVWIGKSAAGNDELLQASHKEDIWFHARHVSGSHVVIRMNRSAEYPSNQIIESVASWAAWYSKAKTAGMVPVVYTKRKFVRKPKGAAPGSVLVDKEQVCLVEPTKPPNSAAE